MTHEERLALIQRPIVVRVIPPQKSTASRGFTSPKGGATKDYGIGWAKSNIDR